MARMGAMTTRVVRHDALSSVTVIHLQNEFARLSDFFRIRTLDRSQPLRNGRVMGDQRSVDFQKQRCGNGRLTGPGDQTHKTGNDALTFFVDIVLEECQQFSGGRLGTGPR